MALTAAALNLSLPHAVATCLQYEEGSAPALALQATIAKTEARFEKYGKEGLLCGTDGLPHLIADPGLALRYGHAGDVLVSPGAACRWLWPWLQTGCCSSCANGSVVVAVHLPPPLPTR